MTFFRQYVAPFLIVLVFLVALLAVSARIFLVDDMAAPAPTEDISQTSVIAPGAIADLPPNLDSLVRGVGDDPAALLQMTVPAPSIN